MTPLGHLSIAFLVGVSASKLLPDINQATIIAATSVGGVILDTDLLYRYLKTGKNILDKNAGAHRFFPSHTPFFALVISLFLLIISRYFGLFFFIGTLTHLFIDTLFFPEGVNIFYPANRKMYAFLTIKTHPFWAPRQISGIEEWPRNYLTSPLFWTAEVVPTILAAVVLLSLL